MKNFFATNYGLDPHDCKPYVCEICGHSTKKVISVSKQHLIDIICVNPTSNLHLVDAHDVNLMSVFVLRILEQLISVYTTLPKKTKLNDLYENADIFFPQNSYLRDHLAAIHGIGGKLSLRIECKVCRVMICKSNMPR